MILVGYYYPTYSILGDMDVWMAGVIQHVVLNESVEVVKIVVNLSISPKTLS